MAMGQAGVVVRYNGTADGLVVEVEVIGCTWRERERENGGRLAASKAVTSKATQTLARRMHVTGLFTRPSTYLIYLPIYIASRYTPVLGHGQSGGTNGEDDSCSRRLHVLAGRGGGEVLMEKRGVAQVVN